MNSCRYFFEVAEKGIACDTKQIRELIEFECRRNAKNGYPLSSFLYMTHSYLRDGIKNQSELQVRTALELFQDVPIFTPKIEIRNYSSSEYSESEIFLLKNVMKNGIVSGFGEKIELRKCEPEESVFMKAQCEQAIDLISTHYPTLYREICILLTDIVYYFSEKTSSGSSFDYLGMMTINVVKEPQDWTTILESIVHEATHQNVFHLMQHDELVLTDQNELFPSSVRTDLRPMIGIFHALVVMARLIYFMNKVSYSNELLDLRISPAIYHPSSTSRYREKFEDLLEVAESYGDFTELGWTIIEDCKNAAKLPINYGMFRY